MDEAQGQALREAETALIAASEAFRLTKDQVQQGVGTDEDVWPLLDARKRAYEHWRAVADPLVAQGVPLSPAVLKVLNDHRR